MHVLIRYLCGLLELCIYTAENKNVKRSVKQNEADETRFVGSGQRKFKTNWHKAVEKESQLRNRSLTTEMHIHLDQSVIPKRESVKKFKKKNPSLEVNKRTSSARRNRREKLEKQRHQGPDYSSSTTISTVLGDLGKEVYTDSSNKEIDSEGDDVLQAAREITLAPPPLKNISNRQYVEQKNNKKFSTCDLEDAYDEEYEHLRSDNDTPVKVAIAVQRLCRPLAGLGCGLLGGISLWQCLIMQQWSGPLNDSFMDYIPDHIRHLQSLFYLLGTISFVSALDSCDLGHLNGRHFRYCFPRRKAPLFVAAILMVTLFVSLFGAPLDDQLDLSMNNNRSISYKMIPNLVGWDIEWWVTMNAVRCAGGLLAWLLFSLCLGTDTLQNHLVSLIELSKCKEDVAKKAEKENNTTNLPS